MSFYTEPAFFILAAVALVPAVVAGCLGRRPKVYGLLASIVFLALLFFRDLQGAAFFGVFLAVSCATTAFTFKLFEKDAAHKVALYRVALLVALLPLICAKVSAVFDANLLGFIGISYLSFKTVQVLIEIRDGLIAKLRPFDFICFLLFFPVFTSGPIMRSRDFCAQMEQPLSGSEYRSLLARGAAWFVAGVVYSFVFAMFFQWLQWFAPQTIGTASVGAAVLSQLVQALCYGLFLFFDFAGYSFMAMGIGAALGIEVPRNFNAPFASIDIKDFWNRWHITLSYWLRDYVFMRVSKACIKRKVFKERVYTACAGYMCNMTLMGFWHGITVDYVVYGIYHGLLLSGCELFQRKSKFYKKHKKEAWFKVCSWAVTMVAVFFGFALFSGQVTQGLAGAFNG